METIPATDQATSPIPVRPLDYRRAHDVAIPPEPSTRWQVWMGIGLFVVYLLWFGRGLLFNRILNNFFRFDSYYVGILVYRFIAAIPLMGATVYVMRRKVWDAHTSAVLLIAGWIVACSGGLTRGFDIFAFAWAMVLPIGAAVYLLAIRRYRGVAVGLFIAMGLAFLIPVSLFLILAAHW